MNRKYLNEENYQKMNKSIKMIAIIIVIVGILLIGFGVFRIIQAGNIKVPNMSASDWFEKSSSQSSMKATGMMLCMFGAFITIAGFMVMSIPYRRNLLAYGAQTVMPVAKESLEEIAPSIGNVVKEIKKGLKPESNEDDIYCRYCGNSIAIDSRFCKKCGKEQ